MTISLSVAAEKKSLLPNASLPTLYQRQEKQTQEHLVSLFGISFAFVQRFLFSFNLVSIIPL